MSDKHSHHDEDAQELDVEADVTSDPARSDADGEDWTGEGGATPKGPATAPHDDSA